MQLRPPPPTPRKTDGSKHALRAMERTVYREARVNKKREHAQTRKRSMQRRTALTIGERLRQQLQEDVAHARDAQPRTGIG